MSWATVGAEASTVPPGQCSGKKYRLSPRLKTKVIWKLQTRENGLRKINPYLCIRNNRCVLYTVAPIMYAMVWS